MNIERTQRMRLRDVLVLTLVEVSEEEKPLLTELAEELRNACNIPVIVLQGKMTLETFSEADMLRAGWIRMERRGDVRNGHHESERDGTITDRY